MKPKMLILPHKIAQTAAELAKHYPVQTMAHWSQRDARPKIQAALETIAECHDTLR